MIKMRLSFAPNSFVISRKMYISAQSMPYNIYKNVKPPNEGTANYIIPTARKKSVP